MMGTRQLVILHPEVVLPRLNYKTFSLQIPSDVEPRHPLPRPPATRGLQALETRLI